MLGHRRAAPRVLGLVVALLVLGGWTASPPGAATVEASLPAWHGGIDLYRPGVFTTQASWLWCTAADIQIARNIVDRQHDHRSSAQRRYFDWMRDHNHYDLPLSAGVDPQGWAAGFRHFVDPRYRLVASRTFDAALRLAVTRLRLTNLPVGITVSHGNHAWLLTGFTATADPLRTSSFRITSVRVTGPLWGLQSRGGYDMRPDTKLTPAQLRTYFTPWRYAPMRMIWDGRYVSIQPVPASTSAAVTPGPSARPSPPASPEVASTSPSAAISGAPPSAASAAADPSSAVALAVPGSASSSAPLDVEPVDAALPLAIVLGAVVLMAVGLGVLGWRRAGRRTAR